MPDLIELLTADQVAARLGVAPATLADWRLRGCGPRYRKLGRRCLYPVAELNAWIEAQPLRRSTQAE